MTSLDIEYEIESRIPNSQDILYGYQRSSNEVAACHRLAKLNVAYGPDARHLVDIFPAAHSLSPVILFLHGGYWTAGSKESRRFPAKAWNERGVVWAPVEYRLAPAVSLDEIVNDVRTALAWVFRNADRFGADPNSIHVCGNSAGGHLVGMLLATDWEQQFDIPASVIKSATAISGLFDLLPLRQTFVNEWLKLDDDNALRNSPVRFPPPAGLPVILSWGGKESNAFKRQSQDYADVCRKAGALVTIVDRSAADHYSIIGELAEPNSPLFGEMAKAIDES